MQKLTALFSAALLSAGLLATSAAHAQEGSAATGQQEGSAATGQQDPAATTAPQASADDFSDEEIQQFSVAAEEVSSISQEYSQQLQQAEGQQAQQEIQMEANEKMVKAVEDSGMDVDTFNAIGQAAQQDPELMKEIEEQS